MELNTEETLVRAMFDRKNREEMRRMLEARLILTTDTSNEYDDAKNRLMYAGVKAGF